MPAPYSAGSIFVQVLPSFKDNQNDISREYTRRGEEASKKFSEGFDKQIARDLPKAMEKAARNTRQSQAQAGEAAGKEYGHSFRNTLVAALKAAEKDIERLQTQPNRAFQVPVDVDSKRFLGDLAKLAREVGLTRADLTIGADVGQALYDIDRLIVKMKSLRDETVHPEVRTQLGAGLGAMQAGAQRARQMAALEPQQPDQQVQPIQGAFRSGLQSRLQSSLSALPPVRLDADTSPAEHKIAAFRTEAFALLSDLEADIDLDPVATIARVETLMTSLEGVIETADPEVEIDASFNAAGALAQIKTWKEAVSPVEIPIEPEMGFFRQRLAQQIKAAATALPEVPLDFNGDDAVAEMARIRAELVSLGEDVKIGADLEEARVRIRELTHELGELRRTSPNIEVDVDAARAIVELKAVEHAAKDADAALHKSARGADDGANSFRAFSGVVLGLATIGPLVIPVVGALGGAIGALGPLAVAGAAGIGVFALAVMGLGDALKAMQNVQDNAAKDATTYASNVRNASRSLRDAEQSVADARQSAADSAVRSQERIVEANRRVTDAEGNLRDAQKDARQAQEDLTQAREDASQRLLDLQLQIRGGELAERRAIMQLAEAEVAYANAMADPGATRTEREQLLLDLDEQRLRVDEVRVSNKRLAEDQKEAARTGVEGSAEVVRAQEQVKTANDNVAEAQQGVAEAVADVAKAQAESQRAAADSARAISDAQIRLADAQMDYTDAINKTSSSQDQLAQSMAKLTPAGRDFAEYLFSLKGYFRDLQESAAAGILPGVQEWMQGFIGTYGPQFQSIVGGMSEAVGNMFRRFGDALQTPAWADFFDMLESRGPIFIDQMGQVLTNVGTGVASLLTAFAPSAQAFGDGMVRASETFANWAAGLADTEGFKEFIDWWDRVGPKVIDFFKALFEAVWNLGVALAPYAEDLMVFVTAVLDMIAGADPGTLGAIALAVIGVAVAFQTLVGLNALISGFGAIIGLVNAALEIFNGTAIGTTAILTGWAGIAAIAIAALAIIGVGLYLLWTRSETFRDIVTGAWNAIMSVVRTVVGWFQTYVMPVIMTVLDAIGTAFEWLWNNILQPIFSVWQVAWGVLWDFLVDMWNKFGEPLFKLMWSIVQELWEIVEPILTLLGMGFEYLFNWLAGAWEHVGKPIFDAFIAVVTWLWENVIDPVLGFIADAFGWLFGVIESAWNNLGKPVFDLIQTVVEALVGVFQGSFDGIKAVWDALMGVFLGPIRFVVETVLNDGLIAGINWIASLFTDDEHWIPDIPTGWIDAAQDFVSFNRAYGGPIPGSSPNKRADNILVHATAGEYMHDVDAVDYYGVEAMDAINNRLIPREWLYGGAYADGGLVYPKLIDIIDEKFPSARITSSFRLGDPGYHGSGRAIDIAGAQPYPDPSGMREMLDIDRWLASTYGSNIAELIHTDNGSINIKDGQQHTYNSATQEEHRNHVHWAMDSLGDLLGASGVGFAGGLSRGASEDSVWGNIWDFISAPFDFLGDIVRGAAGFLTENPFGKLLLKIPMKIAEGIWDVLLELTGFGGGTQGYDQYMDESYYRTLGIDEGSSVQEQVRAVAAGYGWGSGPQWSALYALINSESSWNPNAANPTSSARGLFQKMTSIHGPIENTPAAQAQWGLEYIADRYGDPMSAWTFHLANGWYGQGGLIGSLIDGGLQPTLHDDGGVIDPGWNLINNATRQAEASLNPEQLANIRTIANRGGGPLVGSVPMTMLNGPSAAEVLDEFEHRVTVASRGGKYGGDD